MGVSVALSSLGVKQTWQDVTGSRAGATQYTNTTCKPIIVRLIQTLSGGFVLNGAQILESVAADTDNQCGGRFSAWWGLR